MSAVIAPSVEEAYLVAILDAADGLDLAEFCWYDPERDDGCYRAWDFQWKWYTCPDTYQVDQGGRAIGKTVSITMRAFAMPFSYPGQKMLLTAPELNHLRPLVDAIEQRLQNTRLLREMRPEGKGGGISRQPHWQCRFKNGTQLISRLPNKDGKGVKGCKPAGTLITTMRGQVPIEDIKVGDMVLTHRGRFRKVLDTFHYQDVLGATVAGAGHRGLAMSDYHTMWGRRNRNPQRKRNLDAPEWFMPYYQEDVERWYMASPVEFPALEVPSMLNSPEVLRFAGRWVADGFIGTGGWTLAGERTSMRASVIVSERQLPLVRQFAADAGFKVSERLRLHNGTYEVACYNTALARSLRDAFGELAAGKQTPTWLLGAPREHREAFLDGYLSGDGTFDEKKKRWTADTASKKLAIGLRLLGQSLGYTCGFSWIDPKITHVMGRELKGEPQRCWRVTFTSSNRNAVIEDGFSWQKIRSVVPIEGGIADVYDFTVEQDHSYISDGLVSSNQHVILIELDEAQDYPHDGWVEIVETLNRFLPGAMWRCHGVPKGGRDDFYEKTDDPQWKVHRPMAMHRPMWGGEERKEKINEYGGSRQNIDYKRNIYGEHGDRTNAVFVLAKLMACVDTDEASTYNSDVYRFIRLELEHLQGQDITTFLDFPSTHLNGWSQKVGSKEVGAPKGYAAFYGGMDVGVTNHPSEILIAGQRPDSDKLDIILRIQMQRINTDDQKRVIEAVFSFYGKRLRSFALDKTGVGFPIWDQMTRYPSIGKRVQGYNFSEKVCVGFEDRELELNETQEDLAIMRNVVEASTDWLRNDYVDVQALKLPWDKEVLLEFQGQTYMTKSSDRSNPYGRKIYGGGSFHTLDAAKMLIAGKYLPQLDEMMKAAGPQEDVLDIFLGAQYGPTIAPDPAGVVFL